MLLRAPISFFDNSRLKFKGNGYHDMNWGVSPWFSNLLVEFWGHVQFGPYSVVYFLVLSQTETVYTSVYVSKSGNILLTSCDSSDITITPVGSSFPPTQSETPTGFQLAINLGSSGNLEVEITDLYDILIRNGETVYFRWAGNVEGGIRGLSTTYDGIALLEMFTLLP